MSALDVLWLFFIVSSIQPLLQQRLRPSVEYIPAPYEAPERPGPPSRRLPKGLAPGKGI